MKAPRSQKAAVQPDAAAASIPALAGNVDPIAWRKLTSRLSVENETAIERDRLAAEVRAVLPDLNVRQLQELVTVIELRNADTSCGVMAPFESFLQNLLTIAGFRNDPSFEQIESAFEDFRFDFEAFIKTARVAYRKYPDLVAPEGGDR